MAAEEELGERLVMMMMMRQKKPEVDDEEKLESGGEVGKGGVDRVSHLSWVWGNSHWSLVCGNLSDMINTTSV